MGHWLAGNKNTQPPAAKLRIQTSIQGVIRPIVWGQTRIAGNLIDYADFRSYSPSGGKGGATGVSGKGAPSQTTYTATVAIGLCEGPGSVVAMWENKNFGTTAAFHFTIFTGTYSQSPWGYMTTAHPTHALNYRGLVYAAQANMDLGSSPEIPQMSWEILSSISYGLPSAPPTSFVGLYGTNPANWPPIRQGSTALLPTSGVPDANPRDVIIDALTNTHYGALWPSNRLDLVMNDYSSSCLALGLLISPALVESKDFNSFIQEILDNTIAGARWSNGILSIVPYYDTAIVSGTQSNLTETHIIPVPVPPLRGATPQPTVQVGVGSYVSDNGVVRTGSGTPLTKIAYTSFGAALSTGRYMVNPTGLYTFARADEGVSVDISYVSVSQASYQPYNTPIYDISDFLPNEGAGGGEPIVATRKPAYYQANSVKLEWLDRNNNYDPSVVEVKDQASIDAYVLRQRDMKQAHMFCLGASATVSATLQLQREKIPNTYVFTVGPQYILLDVEDIVTLTRAPMGLVQQPVRIIEIQENAGGSLTITAEEYMGTVSAPLYGSQFPVGAVANYNQDPGNANTPILFEPTDQLAGGLQIWGAVSGSSSIWGGCNVWASYDGVTYAQIGVINGSARMGVLAAALPAVTESASGDTIDTTNTLSVNLTESAGTLLSGSAVDLTSFNTKCFVDGEIIAYQTATLTGTNLYDLTTLNRGGFGTSVTAHAAGTAFTRLDSGIFTDPYDQSRIGTTVFFKFQSFNVWRGGVQDLADVGAVPYVITGIALASPLPNVTNIRNYFEAGFMKIYWDEIDDFRNGIVYEVRKGTSFSAGLTVGVLAHPPFVAFGDETYWISARCQPVAGLTVYSDVAQNIAISGSALTPNIIKSWDEKTTGWAGYFEGGAKTSGTNPNAFVTLQANIATGVYEVPRSHWIDVGYVAPTSISASYIGTGTPAGQDILTIPDILAIPDILGGAATGLVDVHLEIAISQEGIVSTHTLANSQVTQSSVISAWQGYENLEPLIVRKRGTPGSTPGVGVTFCVEAGREMITLVRSGAAVNPVGQGLRPRGAEFYTEFGPWQKFVPGVYLGRMFKMRMVLTTSDPKAAVPNGLSFTWQAIVPARIDHYSVTTSAVADTTITFKPDGATSTAPFNFGPNAGTVPFVNYGITNAVQGDTIVVVSLTLTALTFHVIASGGGQVARNVNVNAEGA